MSKHRIAILISLMLAMPAAVVALEQSAPEYVPAAVNVQPAGVESGAQPAAEGSDAVVDAAPSGGFVRAKASDTFPKGETDTEWERVPAAAAYLDRLERSRGNLIARGDSFPAGTLGEDYYQPLPAQVAYFQRRERVANAQPATQPAGPVAAAAPAEEARNPVQKATDYISGLFKSDSTSTPAESTAAASSVQ